jgi:hypothetical protein
MKRMTYPMLCGLGFCLNRIAASKANTRIPIRNYNTPSMLVELELHPSKDLLKSAISVNFVNPSDGEIVMVRHRNINPEENQNQKNPSMLHCGWFVDHRRIGEKCLYLEHLDRNTNMVQFMKDCKTTGAETEVTWISEYNEIQTICLPWCDWENDYL